MSQQAMFNRELSNPNYDKTNPDACLYKTKYTRVIYKEITVNRFAYDGKSARICQITDPHINYCNEEDLKNPTLASTYENRLWLKGHESLPRLKNAMAFGKYSDKIVFTGDVLDYISQGAMDLVKENVIDKLDNAVYVMGNHETTQQMQGKVADTLTYEQRINMMKDYWPNDIYYYSEVVNDCAMIIGLNNGFGSYDSSIPEKLAADIEKARLNNYVILIFQHNDISTGNPEDTAVKAYTEYDGSTWNFYNNMCGPNDKNETNKEVYNLITSSADVIKGIFSGHLHSGYYTEIKAKNYDGTDAVIPQHSAEGCAYDNGHTVIINVVSSTEAPSTAAERKIVELDELEEKRVNEIRNTKSNYDATGKTVFYVSTSGNDSNNGLSENKPFKTIAKATDAAYKANGPTVILLKRGDKFNTDTIGLPTQCTLSAYGTGAKPIMDGFEDGSAASDWTLYYEDKATGQKIWQYKKYLMDVGAIFFNGGITYAQKDDPYSINQKLVFEEDTTKEYTPQEGLDADLKFVSTTVSAYTQGKLYLRCDKGNPANVFDQVKIATRITGIIPSPDSKIDNICIQGYGGHGIGSSSCDGLTVTNCELRWIGGSLLDYYDSGYPERYGNAIEVYGSAINYTVENCLTWQIYDAGITFQRSTGAQEDGEMRNIVIKNNVVTDCVYSIEYYLAAPASGYKISGDNILIDGNIVRRTGYGFGYNRHNHGADYAILGWSHDNPFTNFVISNNILDRSITGLSRIYAIEEKYLPKFENNTYIQGYGSKMFLFGSPKENLYYYANNEDTQKYTLATKETGAQYYISNGIVCGVYPYTAGARRK